jgi:hypothetical protein
MNAVEQRNQMLKEKFSKEIAEAQKEMHFPAEDIPHNFREVLNRVLNTKCVHTMQCSWPMMKSLISDDVQNFTLEQMGLALNAIERTTPEEYMCTLEEYAQLMDMQEEMARIWNNIWNPKFESIQRKYASTPPLFIPHKKK